MSEPTRFKLDPNFGLEGVLMALGADEGLAPGAIHRATKRLGLSSAVLASAAITTAPAASAATAAASSAAGTSLLATLIKSTILCVSLGVVSYGSVRLVRSGSLASGIAKPSPVSAAVASNPVVARQTQSVSAVSVPSSPAPAVSLASATSNATEGGIKPYSFEVAPSQTTHSHTNAATARFDDVEQPVSNAGATSAPSQNDRLANAVVAQVQGNSAIPTDARLAREVASLDRVRGLSKQGNSARALSKLTAFERSVGYASLRTEALLVKIDVLLSLGHRSEAAAIARDLMRIGAPATQRSWLEAIISNQPKENK